MDGGDAVLNPESIDGRTVKVEITVPDAGGRAALAAFDTSKYYWVQIGGVAYGPVAPEDTTTLVLLIVVDATKMVNESNEISLDEIFEVESEQGTPTLPEGVEAGTMPDSTAASELNTAIEAIEGLTVSIEKTFGTETTKDA